MLIDQKEPPTLTKDQNKVHNHIFSFYNNLFAAEDTSSTLPDIQEFMKGINTETRPEAYSLLPASNKLHFK